MNESCNCKVEKFPNPTECPTCHQWTPVESYTLVYCPLHAHAQELVEACKELLRFAEGSDPIFDRARQAITLAEQTP